ncbi:hypothetical protein HID58_090914, partial [Brassica napus]
KVGNHSLLNIFDLSLYLTFNTQQSTLNSDSINYKRLKSEDLGGFSTIFTYANTCSNMSINIHNLHSKNRQKKKKRKMEEDNMECWSTPFISGQSSSNFIYPFHSFNNVSGTILETQGGRPLHEHYYAAPPAMVESSYGEASNTNNGYETKKKKMTNEQLKLLEINFQEEMKLDPDRKMKLSKELGLQPRQIANRKARWKNKQLEHLYESLRQEFDVICQEKKLLQEELMQLKAMIRENGASNNKQQTWENALSAQFQLN